MSKQIAHKGSAGVSAAGFTVCHGVFGVVNYL